MLSIRSHPRHKNNENGALRGNKVKESTSSRDEGDVNLTQMVRENAGDTHITYPSLAEEYFYGGEYWTKLILDRVR